MTIQVRVLSAGALAQMRTLEAQQQRNQRAQTGFNRSLGLGFPALSKWGNQVQWAGRQLMYNFTLPIIAAMGYATKWALEQEKGMTRIEKVYGDGSEAFRRMSQGEIPALEKAFTALSNRFGVHRQEVLGIAGDWAAAGASGIALAKSVELTLKTMVLGELEAVDATRQLIAIQAQYGMSTTQLSKTVDILNMVENQTGSSMKDLMDAMSRAAGVARVAGVDIEHLAAMTAALTPAAGSAATAGNGLKTIISRLLSPTTEAVNLLGAMGIETDKMSWNSMSAGDRIEYLSGRFDNLSSAQKTHMATVLGSRWQLNKLIILMDAVRNKNSYYWKSLNATNDAQKVFKQGVYELNKVLESNPQKVKQVGVILQNSMADVIIPLIPAITYLAQKVAELGQKFQGLSPEVQKLVLALLIFLAAIGPIARYIGAVANLMGLMAGAVHFAALAFLWLGKTSLLLIPRLLMLPLRPLIALFTLLGPAAMRAGAMMLAAFGGLGRILVATLMVPMIAFMAPFVMLWRRLVVTLQLIWAAFMIQMRAITVAGGAALMAAWSGVLTMMGFIFYAWRVGALTAWGAFMAASRLIIASAGAGLVALWATIHTAMAAVAVAWRAGMAAIWMSVLVGGRAFVMALGAVFSAIPAMLMALSSATIAALTSPWTFAIAAVLAIIYAFRDQIANAWQSIVAGTGNAVQGIANWFRPLGGFFNDISMGIQKAFWALPAGIRNAMIAVISVVQDAAMQVYEWMSYLNPFARHSPSVVDNVRKGWGAIGTIYEDGSRRVARSASGYKAHKQGIASQQGATDRWKKSLDAANRALDSQQAKLQRLQDVLSGVQEKYDTHQQQLEKLASTPIKGYGKMEDAIFDNEMAQKRLRLEIMRMEGADGGIEAIQGKIQSLQGDIEMLSGRAASLRAGGAGSDVTGVIDKQVTDMKNARQKLTNQLSNNPLAQMEAQLASLGRKGEMLDLEKSIKFDPLVRQIDKVANAQKEMSFEDIISGVRREKSAMDALEPRLRSATAAVKAQEAVVKSATASRDAIQRRYDKENETLGRMKKKYDDLTGAMKRAKGASDLLGKGKGPKPPSIPTAVKTFQGGAGANWNDVGGNAKIGRETNKNETQAIEQFAKDQANKMGNMFGQFDMMKPLKEKWNIAWNWLKENVGPVVGRVRDAITAGLQRVRVDLGALFTGGKSSAAVEKLRAGFDKISNAVQFVIKWGKRLWKLFGPDIKRVLNELVKAGRRIWSEIGPELGKLWESVKPLAKFLGGVLLVAIKLIASTIGHVLGPVLNFIIDLFLAVSKIVRGVIDLLTGVFVGDMDKVGRAVVNIFVGLIQGIWAVLKGGVSLIWGIIKGLVGGIVGFFKWLYDILVGHSIVPDLINGIIKVFGRLVTLAAWVWNNVARPIVRGFVRLARFVMGGLKLWWAGVKLAWAGLRVAAQWIWNNMGRPVWNQIKKLWNFVKGGLKLWWAGIKLAWAALRFAATWIWNNLGKPVWNQVKKLWNWIKAEIKEWWGRWKTAWEGLKSIGRWIKNNVMDPVFDRIKKGWERVRDWLKDSKNMLAGPARAIVNVIISAVNKLIGGLNGISKILPGIDFHINPIEKFAQGGRLPTQQVGGGFKTNGARAIVGEGKRNYPEFVIPTDPSYRKRARNLLGMAASRIGGPVAGAVQNSKQVIHGDTPAYAIGGWIGDLGKKAWNGVKKLAKNVVSTGYKPIDMAARVAINNAGNWKPPKGLATYGADKMQEWVTQSNKEFEAARAKAKKKYDTPIGGNVSVADPSNPRGMGFFNGGNFTNRMVAHLVKAQQLAGTTIPVMQGGWRPTTSYSGTSHAGDAIDTSTNRSIITALRRVGIAAGDRTGLGNWAPHTHAIPGPSAGYAGGSGVWQFQDYMARGGMNQSYGSPWGLKNGAIIKARRGGVMARIGEGKNDEAVTPLPRNWQRDGIGGGNTTIIVEHLELPNIDSGDKVEELIDNLKALGGKP